MKMNHQHQVKINIKNNLIYNIMFNKTKYDILITTIKELFNYNDKEASCLIYHAIHNLLMDAFIKNTMSHKWMHRY